MMTDERFKEIQQVIKQGFGYSLSDLRDLAEAYKELKEKLVEITDNIP